MFWTLSGNLFHNDGPLTLIGRDENVCCLMFGTGRLTVALDGQNTHSQVCIKNIAAATVVAGYSPKNLSAHLVGNIF